MDQFSQLRVGIIGCGNVVLNDHAPALKQLESVLPSAVSDPADANRQKVMDLLGIPDEASYKSHRAMLEQSQLDYVVLAVPPAFRQEIVSDCADHGVHVLSEKPIATCPVQAAEMRATMAAAGLKLGMVHNYLFYPEYLQINQLISEGAIGDVRHIALNFLGVPDSPGSSDYRPAWRHDPSEAGGGVLMDMMHAFYVAEFLMGGEIQAVSAVVDNLGQPGDPVEDLALVHLYFSQGYATIKMGWGHGPGGVEVSGAEGRIMAFYQDFGTGPFSALESFTLINISGRQTFHPRLEKPAIGNFLEIHQDFVSAVREDRLPAAPAVVGQRSLEAALAAYASALQGRVIELPFAADHPVYAKGAAGLRELRPWSSSPMVTRKLFGL